MTGHPAQVTRLCCEIWCKLGSFLLKTQSRVNGQLLESFISPAFLDGQCGAQTEHCVWMVTERGGGIKENVNKKWIKRRRFLDPASKGVEAWKHGWQTCRCFSCCHEDVGRTGTKMKMILVKTAWTRPTYLEQQNKGYKTTTRKMRATLVTDVDTGPSRHNLTMSLMANRLAQTRAPEMAQRT